jgi:hypothetical protein
MADRISLSRTSTTTPAQPRPGPDAPEDPARRRRLGGRRAGLQRLPQAGGEGPARGDEHGMGGEPKGQLAIVRSRFRHDLRGFGSLIVFGVLFIAAVAISGIGPWSGFWRFNYVDQSQTDVAKILYHITPSGALSGGQIIGGPSLKHPFGVDPIGHDMVAQVMQGTKEEIFTALVVALLATAIGTLIGAVAGYYGKWADTLLMRFTDVVLSVPLLVILVVLANRFSKSGSGWLAFSPGRIWLGWFAPTSSPCGNGTSSRRPARSARRRGGSSCGTCCPTRSARSSSTPR